jgi:SAM-dependent MidA family methyltransferase
MLPVLTPEQAAHAERVMRALHERLAANSGWLAFDDYLRLVLYAPGLGYYSAGSTKFGADGDFVTAPELSALFGRCLAAQCAPLLHAVGGGDLLELGAGTGRLAMDLLQRLSELDQLPDRYLILEVSADLRERQRRTLQALPDALRSRVVWLDALPATPLVGVVLANEVADALPFQRFVVEAGRLYERGVGLSDDGLIDVDIPAGPALASELARIAPGAWPSRYMSELCPIVEPWVASLAAVLARGAVLLIDYGLPRHEYYHPQRDHGTLRCHFRHRAHDQPLLYPGLQDITAWVDFTRVAEAAVEAGLEVAGYCTQAAFLLSTGIEAQVAAAAETRSLARLASQARALLLPGEMGEHFKVMALTRDLDLPLRGFALQDLRRTL